MNDVLRASSVGPYFVSIAHFAILNMFCVFVIASIWREAGRHAAFWHENDLVS